MPKAPITPAATSCPPPFPEQSQSNERNHRPSPTFLRRRRRRLSLAANISYIFMKTNLFTGKKMRMATLSSMIQTFTLSMEGGGCMPITIQGANWSVPALSLDRISNWTRFRRRDWIDWRSISNHQNGYGGGNATRIPEYGTCADRKYRVLGWWHTKHCTFGDCPTYTIQMGVVMALGFIVWWRIVGVRMLVSCILRWWYVSVAFAIVMYSWFRFRCISLCNTCL